jgi:RNA polymerase I-specific transcription initiation factor RRN7
VPITVADIRGWIGDGELLYYRSARETPLEMRQRLPPEYQKLLEPQDVLKPLALQEAVLATLRLFSVEFGMGIPPLNTPLIIARWMKELMLPLELFAGTQRLAKMLEIDGKYDVSKPRTRLVLRYAEVQLMALLVVATKLLFPFDKRLFKTKALTDLSALPMDWDKWVSVHKESAHVGREDPLRYEEAFVSTEADCLAATDDKLDAYLGWCERNIASEDIRSHEWATKDAVFRRALFEMFPLQAHDHGKSKMRSAAPTEEHTSATDANEAPSLAGPIAGAAAIAAASDTSTNAPAGGSETDNGRRRANFDARPTDETAPKSVPSVGSFYRRYRQADELDGPAKILFEKAAKLACVSLDGIIDAVFLTERKLEKIEIRLKKAEAAGQ